MHKLTIHNFGPIKDTTVDVFPFLVMIGPQSSGKSTISKLIYYFLSVRDEVANFILDDAKSEKGKAFDRELAIRLRKHFVDVFGPASQLSDVRVMYSYGPDTQLEVSLEAQDDPYVTPRLSKKAIEKILDLAWYAHEYSAGDP